MTTTTLLAWINAAVTFGTVIMFGCLGETLDQKAGNLNLGIPGIMMLGGIGAVTGSFLYETYCANPVGIVCIVVALLASVLFAAFGGLIYCFLTISLHCNQNVTGLTLTIFGSGVADFFGGALMKLSGGVGQISLKTTAKAFRTRIPFLSSELGVFSTIFFNYGFMVYAALILAVLLHLFLNRTRTGLNLRAVGENPATADACSISVTKYKYLAGIIGAVVAGLGGAYYSMDYVIGTWNSDGSIEALGWLAVALVIFTSWKPLRAIWGSYLFGVCYWIQLYIPAFISNWLASVLKISNVTYLQNLYKGIPYFVTIVVLIIVSMGKNAVNAPNSLGVNYFREER